MKKWIVFALVYVVAVPFVSGQERLEQWALLHAKASQALGEWTNHHPQTARVLFELDAKHPEYIHEMVAWGIEHKGATIGGFADKHPHYRGADIFGKHHAVAMDEFLHWCNNNAEAAKALTAEDRGLLWAGNNLYKESLHVEPKRR